MATRVGRHQRRAVPAQRSYSNTDPWNQFTARDSAGIRTSQQDFSHIDFSDPYRLPPAPEGCKPPAAWEEWERNACWPFPANMPKELQVLRTPEDVRRETATNVAQNEEVERNRFWPFPSWSNRRTSSQSQSAAQPRPVSRTNSRQRTESNPAPPAPQPRSILKKKSGEGKAPYTAPALASMSRTRSREGAEAHTIYQPVQRPRSILRNRSGERSLPNNEPIAPRPRTPARNVPGERVDFSLSCQPAPRPRTMSGSQRRERRASLNSQNTQPAAPNTPTVTEDPFSYHNRAPMLNSCMTVISPLLAQDSVALIHFDLRLPHTSAKKLVHNHHWTHLNREDIKQPACSPPRTQMRIYTHITGSDWIADVRPGSRDYVTVEDVLMSVYETLNVPVDTVRWARDGINPTLQSRVYRAFNKRLEKVKGIRAEEYSKVKKAGLMRVDYLGSKYLFDGLSLCYGGDESEWFQMQVVAREK